ncbi:MAG: LysR substrate-binding domain-containing protein [Pseudomonadota bacterium]
MTRRLPPLNALKAFEAAARAGHIGRAAEELKVTRGAVSQQIKILEEHLGVVLFDRVSNRLCLTASGQAFLPVVSYALDAIANEALKLQRPNLQGRLTVAAAPALASKWLLFQIDEFWAAYPDIDVRVRVIAPHSRELPEDCDVAIEYGHGNWPGRWVQAFDPADLTPVCSPKLLNASSYRLHAPADLERFRLIHDDDGTMWRRWLTAAGAAGLDARRGLFVDNFVYALDAAVAGLGVALADRVTTAFYLSSGALVRPLDYVFPGTGSYYIVVDPARRELPLVKAFVSWIMTPHALLPEEPA